MIDQIWILSRGSSLRHIDLRLISEVPAPRSRPSRALGVRALCKVQVYDNFDDARAACACVDDASDRLQGLPRTSHVSLAVWAAGVSSLWSPGGGRAGCLGERTLQVPRRRILSSHLALLSVAIDVWHPATAGT